MKHPHAFLKIRTPGQTPPLIFASMESHEDTKESCNNDLKNVFESFMPNANCRKEKIERKRYDGKALRRLLEDKLEGADKKNN